MAASEMNRAITPPFAYGVSHALTKASIYLTCSLRGTGASTRTASLDVFRRMPHKADEYWAFARSLTPKVSGAGAPQVRRAPTQAMKMPKAWPVLASA
jgi:hypothetical protein